MESRASQKHNKYYNWWEKIEKRLVKAALFLFLLLYTAQAVNFIIMQRDGTMLTSRIERLEGKAISDSQTKINTGTIDLAVISNSDFSGIEIYINGDYYTSFTKKSISLTVKNNDIIEISGIKSQYPAKIKIENVSQNVLGINLHKIINVNKNFVMAGRIRLK
ncbi:MAG: hypothetical protein K0R84_1412 [Clostridia bacterium]|jgi:hypothetical protein|nr:hypothetical protein [Clostridia bacterium]